MKSHFRHNKSGRLLVILCYQAVITYHYLQKFNKSSRLLKKEYPQIREKLWKEAFWSQSFCLLTAGGAPIDIIRNYIETQGEKKR